MPNNSFVSATSVNIYSAEINQYIEGFISFQNNQLVKRRRVERCFDCLIVPKDGRCSTSFKNSWGMKKSSLRALKWVDTKKRFDTFTHAQLTNRRMFSHFPFHLVELFQRGDLLQPLRPPSFHLLPLQVEWLNLSPEWVRYWRLLPRTALERLLPAKSDQLMTPIMYSFKTC